MTWMAKATYAFVALGCPKNLVDSERMLGLLQREGYQLVEDPQGTDFVVVNTCGFIEAAREESLAAIDEMLALKREGRTGGVIVAGCLAERQREELLRVRPDIDALIGVFARDEVARAAASLVSGGAAQRSVFRPAPPQPLTDRDRHRATPRHWAYLKISEGCDRLCTFCSIPRIRGKHRSKPVEEIAREAEQLAADGVRELILVAQDTSYYGMDVYGEPRLVPLLARLQAVPGIEWIRLMYLYPQHVSDALIDMVASGNRILPYLDLPLQHISDSVLRRMARRVTRGDTETLLGRLRERIPGLVLRTTFITGFPGETQAEFEELLEFVQSQRFERVGVFPYSCEPDTPAARLPQDLPKEVKNARRDRLMTLQQSIAFRWNESRRGTRTDVILDRPLPDGENVWIGRSYADAPDVDGLVFVTGGRRRLATGQIVPCEIVASRDYDLVGVAVGPPR